MTIEESHRILAVCAPRKPIRHFLADGLIATIGSNALTLEQICAAVQGWGGGSLRLVQVKDALAMLVEEGILIHEGDTWRASSPEAA